MEEGHAEALFSTTIKGTAPTSEFASSRHDRSFASLHATIKPSRSILGSALYLSDFLNDFLNFYKGMR